MITGDELWFFAYDPSVQQANKVYVKEDEPNLKTRCWSRSNIKSLLILFFDKWGIVHQEFFKLTPEARVINRQYYLDTLKQLWARIVCVRPELFVANSWVLHHNNAPPHMSHAVVYYCLAKNGTTQMLNFPFSPDMACVTIGHSQKSKKRWKRLLGKCRRDWTNYDTANEVAYTRRIRRLFPAVGGALVPVR